MRKFIDIVRLPSWWAAGSPVDVTTNQYDAAEFLEGEEFDYEYRLCIIPTLELDAHAFHPDRLSTPSRIPEISKWMHAEGPMAGLLKNPPVALLTSTGLVVLDGWHRIGTAIHKMNLDTIPCIVGLGERVDA